ncbi:MGMT family protein [Corynebacterium callunae]|uniref:MGMT family protein n=1 Tax=Corynebacterium callunae TaxID=1721 RepID=UPI003981F118
MEELDFMVLSCVDAIPTGRVATYGDIAALTGTGPRQVGRIMAEKGQLSNWWRVVRFDGGSQVSQKAQVKWDSEGIVHSGGANPKVRMSQHRLSEAELLSLSIY